MSTYIKHSFWPRHKHMSLTPNSALHLYISNKSDKSRALFLLLFFFSWPYQVLAPCFAFSFQKTWENQAPKTSTSTIANDTFYNANKDSTTDAFAWTLKIWNWGMIHENQVSWHWMLHLLLLEECLIKSQLPIFSSILWSPCSIPILWYWLLLWLSGLARVNPL